VTIEPAKVEDLLEILEKPRVWEAGRVSKHGIESYVNTLKTSEAWTIKWETKPLIVLGLSEQSLVTRSAMLWLMAGEVAEQDFIARLRFGYYAKFLMVSLRERFDYLYGIVCIDQPGACRFLQWLGFSVESPFTYNDLSVSRFSWSR